VKTLFRSHSGGVLIYALILILVAAAMTAGWVSVMGAQVLYAGEFATAVQRRIAFENASAVARQYALTNVVTKNSAAGVSASVGSGWGAVTIAASAGAPLTSFQKVAGYNHFNPGNGDVYAEQIAVSVTAGDASYSRVLQVKSRSPILGGTLAQIHAPALLISGSASSSGRTVFWEPASSISIASQSFGMPLEPSNTLAYAGGGTALPSNFPFAARTGSEVMGVSNYAGALDVVANASGINSLAVMAAASAPNGVQSVSGSTSSNANGVVSDGAGNVTIDLLDATLGNVVITGDVTNLVFTGQTTGADRVTAGNEAAILVLVNQDSPATNLAQVDFNNSNYRKLVLAIKTASGVATSFNFPQAASGSWRMMLVLESTPVTLLASGGLTLEGGIQTDRAVAIGSGSLALQQETDPRLLDRLAPRDGWVEMYEQ